MLFPLLLNKLKRWLLSEFFVASAGLCDLINKKNCCSDEQLVVDGQYNLKISFDKLDKEQQLLVATFIYSYINLFTEQQTENTSFRDYSPPPLVRDVQVLDQTFLI